METTSCSCSRATKKSHFAGAWGRPSGPRGKNGGQPAIGQRCVRAPAGRILQGSGSTGEGLRQGWGLAVPPGVAPTEAGAPERLGQTCRCVAGSGQRAGVRSPPPRTLKVLPQSSFSFCATCPLIRLGGGGTCQHPEYLGGGGARPPGEPRRPHSAGPAAPASPIPALPRYLCGLITSPPAQRCPPARPRPGPAEGEPGGLHPDSSPHRPCSGPRWCPDLLLLEPSTRVLAPLFTPQLPPPLCPWREPSHVVPVPGPGLPSTPLPADENTPRLFDGDRCTHAGVTGCGMWASDKAQVPRARHPLPC